MELTRFDLKNQAIQERIAEALERIAEALERGLETVLTPEQEEAAKAIGRAMAKAEMRGKVCPLCGELLGPEHDERAGQCPGVAK